MIEMKALPLRSFHMKYCILYILERFPERCGRLERSANDPQPLRPTAPHANIWLPDRQIPSGPDISSTRGTEVAADCNLAFSYAYAATREHMQYLPNPPPHPPLQSSSHPHSSLLLPLFSSQPSIYVCTGKSKEIPEVSESEHTFFPAILEKIESIRPAAWHGKQKGWKD